MLCPQCKKQLPADAQTCPYCGASPEYGRWLFAGEKIPNYLWLSLVTLVVCMPMGAAALVYSLRTEKYVMLTDYRAAWEASFKARRISLLGLTITGIAAGVYLLSMALLMLVVK